jgi:TatD DNase family protein
MIYIAIDSHCHIHFNAYRQDMAEVIARTQKGNVAMITVGTQRDTSKNGVDLASRTEGLWATVGLHPNHLFPVYIDEDEAPFMTREESFDYAHYYELAQHPKVVAIGECGLDWYRIPENRSLEEVKAKQREVFRQHLDLCEEVTKPVMIHCRDAHQECADILEEYVKAGKLQRRGVIHCFTGTIAEAQRYHSLGFFTSLTGVITFPPKKSSGESDTALQRVVRALPLKWILIETDAPYLTPVPHRGKRNEPLFVLDVARSIAVLQGRTVDEVLEVTRANARRLFGIIV